MNESESTETVKNEEETERTVQMRGHEKEKGCFGIGSASALLLIIFCEARLYSVRLHAVRCRPLYPSKINISF